MYVSRLRLVNFRSYCDAAVSFADGLNVVVGENAAGKTNLIEGAWFALRGASPRTRREDKLVTWGQRYTRVELDVEGVASGVQRVDVAYALGQGKRTRWNGVEVPSQEDLRARSHVFIFVPESLLLVKGSPARRRAHLDTFAAALDPQYAAAAHDLQAALRQRNAQLLAIKHGGSVSALDPWDVQFARAAVELGRRRRDLVEELGDLFAAIAAGLAPAGGVFGLRLVAHLATVGYEEEALLGELRERRRGEISRGLSLFGPHRDDLRFVEIGADEEGAGPVSSEGAGPPLQDVAATGPVCGPVELPRGGRDLRLFGSQGEQRAAVLALLLAEQRLAAARTGVRGTLFLDDVMSELDDSRRRLLVAMLAAAGQAIITTTNRQYFTTEELEHAAVIELPLEGSVVLGGSPPADALGPAPPDVAAL